MTGGVHVAPGGQIVINGIDVQRCVDYAVERARWTGVEGKEDPLWLTLREQDIAAVGAHLLKKLRTKGYSKEICRDALWAKIVDEAQRLRPAEAAGSGDVGPAA